MTSVDSLLRTAVGRKGNWSETTASLVGWPLSLYSGYTTHWDHVAGERWITLASPSGEAGVLLWTEAPLAIVFGDAPDLPFPVVNVRVSSPSATELKASSDLVADIFGGASVADRLTCDEFSAHDLVYLTI